MATTDITPELMDKLQKDFDRRYKQSKVVKSILAKKKITPEDAYAFAVEIGNIQAKVFKNGLSSSVLPNGRMYFNIADQIIRKALGNDYDLIKPVAMDAQLAKNKESGISLSVVEPTFDEENAKSIIDKVSADPDYDHVAWMLGAPILTFTQKIVDSTFQNNARKHKQVGLKVMIVRISEGNCCPWCDSMDGSFDYDEAPSGIWGRHNDCRCKINTKSSK